MIIINTTTKKIAEICKVSVGTVDRALNNRTGIAPATKAMILDAAQKYNYSPNTLARSLVKGKTMSLGFVTFDLNNQFFVQLANSIENHAQREDYFIYLTLTSKNKAMEKKCIENLFSRKVDGIILCSVNEGASYTQYLKRFGIPLVTLGNFIDASIPFISIDDKQAMKDAVKYALGKGYTELIFASPPISYKSSMNIYAQQCRLDGFNEAIKENSKDLKTHIIIEKDYNFKIAKIVENKSGKIAVMCSSDIFALEVMIFLKSKGFSIPNDVGLMGFDNLDVLKYVEPKLTTVAFPVELIGEEAVKCMVSQIDKQIVQNKMIIKHSIIEGESL